MMSKPFELILSDGYRNAHIGTCLHNDPENRLYDFMAVKLLDTTFDYQLRFEVDTTSKIIQQYDIVWVNTPNDILLSPKVMAILNELCPQQIQIFDATIECKDGFIDMYKAINILNEFDVSDSEKSRYKYFDDGEIRGYHKFVIKDQPMESIHIARDARLRPKIILSATLKEAFEKAKVKGCDYWAGD